MSQYAAAVESIADAQHLGILTCTSERSEIQIKGTLQFWRALKGRYYYKPAYGFSRKFSLSHPTLPSPQQLSVRSIKNHSSLRLVVWFPQLCVTAQSTVVGEVRAPSFVLSPHSNKSNINSEHNSASLEFSSVGPGSLPAWHTDSQRSADFREEGDVVVTCHHLRKEGALTHTSKFVSASCKKSFPEQK